MSRPPSRYYRRLVRRKCHIAIQECLLIRQERRKLKAPMTLLQKLPPMFLARGLTSVMCFCRPFRMIMSSSDTINFQQFNNAVLVTEFSFSQDERKQLFAMFDTEASGSINIKEFLQKVRPGIPEGRQKSVADAFNKIDKTGTGIVALADIGKVYNATQLSQYTLGLMTADELFLEYVQYFEEYTVQLGQVTREEFEDYYSVLSMCMASDTSFNRLLRTSFKQ